MIIVFRRILEFRRIAKTFRVNTPQNSAEFHKIYFCRILWKNADFPGVCGKSVTAWYISGRTLAPTIRGESFPY